jgi:hypothetical protein
MRTTLIVVDDPLLKDVSEMTLVQPNHPIQTLTADRADQPFAKRIRCGDRPETRQSHRSDRAIDITE